MIKMLKKVIIIEDPSSQRVGVFRQSLLGSPILWTSYKSYGPINSFHAYLDTHSFSAFSLVSLALFFPSLPFSEHSFVQSTIISSYHRFLEYNLGIPISHAKRNF
uniref:Uncharacterized protein n=1 Tax=Cacopsylla melanoneura TaxID=428564 RepID=A0A8D8R4K9_9HEMI